MKRKLYKHVVVKNSVTFRTYGPATEEAPVRFIRMTKKEWLDKGQPEKLEVSL